MTHRACRFYAVRVVSSTVSAWAEGDWVRWREPEGDGVYRIPVGSRHPHLMDAETAEAWCNQLNRDRHGAVFGVETLAARGPP